MVLRRTERCYMDVGLIKLVIVRDKNIYLFVRRYRITQNQFRLFENTSVSDDCELVNIDSLQDNYPLHLRGTERNFVVLQHHHISFTYD